MFLQASRVPDTPALLGRRARCPATPARLAGSCVQPAALHFWELFARKLLEEDEEAVQGGVDVTVRTEHTSRTAARISLLPANGSVATFSVSPLGVAAQLGGVCFQRFFLVAET